MLSQDEKVKQSRIKATEAVRQKYKDLINNRAETTRLLERYYKPITNELGTIIDLNKKRSHVDGDDSKDESSSTSRGREGMPTPRPRGRPRKHKQFGPPATPLSTKKVKSGSNKKPKSASLYRNLPNIKQPRVLLNRVNDDQMPSTSGFVTPKSVRFQPLDSAVAKIIENNSDDVSKRKRFESPSPIHPTIKPGRRLTRSQSARERLFDDSRMDMDENNSEMDVEGETDNVTAPAAPQGLGMYKKALKMNKTAYMYWDNVNELVSRLRLLIASQTAGHTGHHNEIISIVEELKEAGVIK